MSEKTHSRMLRLEKENQSLSRTIEELRATSAKSSTVANQSHRLDCDQVVCGTDSSAAATDENRSNGFQHGTVEEEMLIGDLKCRQQLRAEELQVVRREIVLMDDPDFHIQETGQLEDRPGGDRCKGLMSELEILENNHNRLCSFVGSRDCLPGSNSSSPVRHFTASLARSSYSEKHTQRLEAKCRALDTFNQHLQTSLDNTSRFCKSNKQ